MNDLMSFRTAMLETKISPKSKFFERVWENFCSQKFSQRPSHLLSQFPPLSPKQRDQLLTYAALLKHSRSHSFASWDSDEKGFEIHFRDSFLTIPKETPTRFLDVGSGAGVPGIIYSILWPNTQSILLESQKKRCAFLEKALSELDLHDQVSVLCGRAEVMAHDPALRESFDLVTARALAPFPQFLEYTAGFVRVEGTLHALRGEKDSNALSEHSILLKKFHLEATHQTSYKLNTDTPTSRFIFLLKKTAPWPHTLPRNNNQIRGTGKTVVNISNAIGLGRLQH